MAIQLDPKRDRALLKRLSGNVERALQGPSGATGATEGKPRQRGASRQQKGAEGLDGRKSPSIDERLCAAGWQHWGHAEYDNQDHAALTHYYWNVYSAARLGPYPTMEGARAAILDLVARTAGEGSK